MSKPGPHSIQRKEPLKEAASECKPTVPETVAALDSLVEANDKLREFIRYLDHYSKNEDRIYRALNNDLRIQTEMLIIEVHGLMKKAELMVEDRVGA